MPQAKQQIRIANPSPGGSAYTSLERAREYQAAGAGEFYNGQFVFTRGDEDKRKLRRLYGTFYALHPQEVSPERSVLQPSLEWLARTSGSHGRRVITEA